MAQKRLNLYSAMACDYTLDGIDDLHRREVLTL